MPAPMCVSCGQQDKRTKLVRCLHALCIVCLEQHVQDDGSIKCPRCATTTSQRAGCSALSSLPDGYPQLKAERTALPNALSATVVCDDCLENRPAMSVCKDCELNYCEAHTTAHSLSRHTRHHQLKTLSVKEKQACSAASLKSALHRCALHPSRAVEHFCMTCSQLLCERCMGTGVHALKQHNTLPILEAAQKTSQSVHAALLSYESASAGLLHKASEQVRKSIQTLHEQTENASQEASDFFASVREALQKQEQKVLAELDDLRSLKVVPLEKQLSGLEEDVAKAAQVTEILKSCDDNVDLLLMGSWLNSAIETAKDSANSDLKPCAVSDIIFSKTSDNATLLKTISKAGSVLDVADVQLKCGRQGRVGNDRRISIKMSKATKQAPFCSEEAENLDMKIVVRTGEDEKTVESSPLELSAASSGELQATYCPQRPGEHVFSATVAGKHIAGSPAKVMINSDTVSVRSCKPQFDADRCHRDVEISNDRRTVRKMTKTMFSYRSACTLPLEVQPGISHVRVRVDHTLFGCIFICLCSSDSPLLTDCHKSKMEVFGWFGNHPDHLKCNGGHLGQKWKDGDVVCILLDHERHTVTGLHERTGISETLLNVTGDLSLYVSLGDKNDQVTIL